jgi:exosortase/archaeosortase family protein
MSRRDSGRRTTGLGRAVAAGRWVLGLAVAACGVFLMVQNGFVRSIDTEAAGWIIQWVAPGPILVNAQQTTLYWLAGMPGMAGLRITSECTSAFLVGPGLLLSGGALVTGRFSTVRVLLGTLAALAIVVLANWTRLGLIGWATSHWGLANGFAWSHTVVGSILVLIGVAAAILVFVVTITRGRRRRARHLAAF